MQKRTVIRSRDADYQVLLAIKTNRRKRSLYDEIFIEGIESVKQALCSRFLSLKKIVFADYSALSGWAKNIVDSELFEERVEMKGDLYAELCDRSEPSELIITASPHPIDIDKLTAAENPFVLLFDRPSDLGNLGSVIRSANAFGVDLVITHGHCVDHHDPKVIRSSLGAVFHTPVVHLESFDELDSWLNKRKRECGMTVVGTDSASEFSIAEKKLCRPITLVLGNEAKGMSVRLKALVDVMVKIPMSGAVNSLNVACAASILMWKVVESLSPDA